jgi:O-glycosyl hydrolase
VLLSMTLTSDAWATSAVTNVSATASTYAAGAKRVVDEIGFKATSAIAGSGFVQLTGPAGSSFSGLSSDYVVDVGASSGYAQRVEVDPEGLGGNVVDVLLPYEMSVAAGSTVTVSVFGVANPTAAVPAGEFAVSTAADTKPVSKPFTITPTTSATAVSASASNYTAGASGVLDTVSFKATGPLTTGESTAGSSGEPGFVQLRAPTGSKFNSENPYDEDYTVTDGSGSAYASATVDPESLGENVVDVYIPREVPVAAGSTVQVIAHGVSNPAAATPSGEYAVSTSSDATAVKKAFAIGGASSVSALSVSANTSSAHAERVVDEIGFKATNAMPAEPQCDYYYYYYQYGCGHFVVLTAPAGTVFPSSWDDYAVSNGASSGYSSYYPEVDPEERGENVVRFQLPYEMSVGAGETVKISVFGVSNPAAPVPAGEFAVSTAADSKPVSRPFPITPATSVTAVSASASNYTAGASGVVDAVSFNATGPLTTGESTAGSSGEPGYVRLSAPTGSKFNSENPYDEDYVVTDGSASAYASATVNPEGLGENVVDVYIPREVPVAAGSTVQVIARGISNPAAATPSGEYAVSSSSDATLVHTAFAITAASSVSALSARANTSAAGASRVVDEVSFKVTNAMPYEPQCDYYYYYYYYGCGHFIELSAPAGTRFPSNWEDYAVSNGATSRYSPYYPEVDPEELGDNVVRFELPYEMSVGAGETIKVSVFGVTNPSTAAPSGEFAVSTAADTKPVSKPFTITPATSVTAVSASASNYTAGASGVVDTASFNATGPLTTGESTAGSSGEPGYVRLSAPTGSKFNTYNPYGEDYTVTDGSASAYASATVNPEDLGENVVDIYIPEGVPVTAGSTVQVIAHGVSNPADAVPSGEYAVSTSSDATAVKKAFAIGAASAVTNLTVSANTFSAHAERVVDEISFKATSAMPAEPECNYYYYYYYAYYSCGHFVELSAPAGTVFSDSPSNYWVSNGSTSGSSSYYAEVNPEERGENVVRFQLPYEMSVAAGETVKISVFGVSNPAAPVPAGEFAVSTAADSKPVSRPFPITPATSVTAVSASASNYTAGASGVVDTVSFNATGPLTTGESTAGSSGEPGYVRLSAPTGSKFNTYNPYGEDYTVTDGSGSAYASATVDPENLGENFVDIYIPRDVPVTGGSTVQVIARGISNPSAQAPSGEYTVSSSSDATPVKKAFPIGGASSVTSVTASANTFSARAERVVDEISFKATNAMPYEPECTYYYFYAYYGCGHFIELSAPAGTVFSNSPGDYRASNGSTSGSSSFYAEVSPEGRGENVVRFQLPYEMSVAAGETIKISVFGISNPTAAIPAGELAVSTAADAKPVSKPFPITAATSVSAVSASASDYAAGATGVLDTVSFKATDPLTTGESTAGCCGEPGYVRLAAPTGSKFNEGDPYTVTDGSASASTSATVDPEGLGENVADVYIPREVPVAAGSTVQVLAHGVSNPAAAAPSGEFAVSTSSDATPLKKAFPIGGAEAPRNESPPTISGIPEKGQVLAEQHGSWTEGPTGYAYQWLRCNASGAECSPIPEADSQTYLLAASDVGHALEVQEIAHNAVGESAPAASSPTAVITPVPLHAVAGEDVSTTAGTAVAFNGSGSSPTDEIASYRWEFGDGASAEGESVSHTYGSPGTYTARLTVSRGTESASDSVTVTVSPASANDVTIEVTDSGHNPLSGATVLYVGSNGVRVQATTGSDGKASLSGLPDGTDAVYAYESGFQPAVGQASVSSGAGEATIALAAGEIAASTLKSHEMTLKEIEEAGINVNDPANQNVYEFEVRLAFIESPQEPVQFHCYINSHGEFVGGCGGGGGCGCGGGGGGGGWAGWGGGGGGGGTGPSCSPHECVGGGIVAVPEIVEGKPLIQWLILRGKASVLKQFFEVSEIVQNLSPEPFKLTAGSATINIPPGMSLAPTATPQSATQAVAAIPGDGSAETNWVVRGDEPGEYLLSANYDAKLEPFEAPVEIEARLASPLKVWGVEALSLNVQADEGFLAEGRPYHVRIGVTNKSDITLYNVEVEIFSNVHERFIFQPDQQFQDGVSELRPGETVYAPEDILVPDAASEAPFNPALSSAHFVGEEIHPGVGIEAVKPPALYSASSTTDTPHFVHLHWQSVPGAEAYEVFPTPTLDTAFEELPSEAFTSASATAPVTVLPGSATEAYLSGVGHEQFYAVSTLIGGQLVLDHPVVRAVEGQATGKAKPVSFQVSPVGSASFTATLPPQSVATYRWTPGSGGVEWWETSASGKKLSMALNSQAAISFGGSKTPLPTIDVEPGNKAQTIEGFGGAMTDSSAYLISKLPEPERSKLLNELFGDAGPNSADFNMVRLPLGASDFIANPEADNPAKPCAAGDYKCYAPSASCDKPSTSESPQCYQEFNIGHDRKYIIPMLQAAKAANPNHELKIIATPWSAPGWMKQSTTFIGACPNTNRLSSGYVGGYAQYLTRAAHEYQEEHLPFSIISLQNEPHNCSETYPTMEMTPHEAAGLADELSQDLTSPTSGLTSVPQILGWDHNWNDPFCGSAQATYPEELLEDTDAVADIGYHSYCGTPHKPNLPGHLGPEGVEETGIYVTESTGYGKPDASTNLVNEVRHQLIEPLRDGAKASLYWNIALDPECGPQFSGSTKKCPKSETLPKSGKSYSGCTNCRPLVTVNDSGKGSVTYNEDFYYWAQFSKFIQPHAVHIASSRYGSLETVAVKNPDGTIVLVVLNV